MSGVESDVDRVKLFRLALRFLDDVSTASKFIFFDSDFQFFDDAPEFSIKGSPCVAFSLQSSCQFFFKSGFSIGTRVIVSSSTVLLSYC